MDFYLRAWYQSDVGAVQEEREDVVEFGPNELVVFLGAENVPERDDVVGGDERELEHGCVEGRSANELGELLISWGDRSLFDLVVK